MCSPLTEMNCCHFFRCTRFAINAPTAGTGADEVYFVDDGEKEQYRGSTW